MKCANCGRKISIWQSSYEVNDNHICTDCHENYHDNLNERKEYQSENWYYADNNEQVGPTHKEELVNLIKQNILQKSDLVWKKGMDDWQMINQVSDFKEYFDERTPPPLPKRNQKKENDTDGFSPNKPKSKTTVNKSEESETEDQKSADKKPEQTNRWLKFYVKFRIPFGILILIINSFFPPNTVLPSEEGTFRLIASCFVIAYLILFWGLYKRKLWGWKFNWFFIFFEPILGGLGTPNEPGQAIIFTALGLLIYSLPNYIYFTKRKYLFEN